MTHFVGPEVTQPALVSVVTACYNAGGTIERTIKSVLGQTHSRIEYLIIDGGSTDYTMRSVDEFRSRLSVVVSEPDDGISDAFNKGIALAAGDYVQFLNADDHMPPTKIADSVRLLEENPDAGFVFGDLTLVDRKGNPVMMVEGDPDYQLTAYRCMPRVNHPTFLVRRSVYEKYGGFEDRWRVSMDYDWLLRVTRAGVRGVYSPMIHAHMQIGGASERDPVRSMNEERLISIRHGRGSMTANVYFLMRVAKLWTRLLLEPILPARVIALLRPGKRVIDVTASRAAH